MTARAPDGRLERSALTVGARSSGAPLKGTTTPAREASSGRSDGLSCKLRHVERIEQDASQHRAVMRAVTLSVFNGGDLGLQCRTVADLVPALALHIAHLGQHLAGRDP